MREIQQKYFKTIILNINIVPFNSKDPSTLSSCKCKIIIKNQKKNLNGVIKLCG